MNETIPARGEILGVPSRPDLEIYGHDKFADPCGSFDLIENVAEVPNRSLVCVCAFEVFKHLFDSDISSFVALVKRVLKANGRLIVSVPIMLGPAQQPSLAERVYLLAKRLGLFRPAR